MANTYFQFKEFRVEQALSGMKVTTDACLFGAWVASESQTVRPMRVLDIGSGTGVLSLMIAQKINSAEVDAVEVNEEAFKETQNNFTNSPWSNRITCTHSPVQEFQSEAYDLIICNPPFFKDSQLSQKKNKNEALHSGLLSAESLIASLQRLLVKKGACYILYPDREMNDFIKLAENSALTPTKIVTVRNDEGKGVFRKMAAFSFGENECEHLEIIIRNINGRYTNEFWHLLKSYYLEYNNPLLP